MSRNELITLSRSWLWWPSASDSLPNGLSEVIGEIKAKRRRIQLRYENKMKGEKMSILKKNSGCLRWAGNNVKNEYVIRPLKWKRALLSHLICRRQQARNEVNGRIRWDQCLRGKLSQRGFLSNPCKCHECWGVYSRRCQKKTWGPHPGCGCHSMPQHNRLMPPSISTAFTRTR